MEFESHAPHVAPSVDKRSWRDWIPPGTLERTRNEARFAVSAMQIKRMVRGGERVDLQALLGGMLL